MSDRFPLPHLNPEAPKRNRSIGSTSLDRFHYETNIQGNSFAISALVRTSPNYALRIIRTFGDKDVASAFLEEYRFDEAYLSDIRAISHDLARGKLVCTQLEGRTRT